MLHVVIIHLSFPRAGGDNLENGPLRTHEHEIEENINYFVLQKNNTLHNKQIINPFIPEQ